MSPLRRFSYWFRSLCAQAKLGGGGIVEDEGGGTGWLEGDKYFLLETLNWNLGWAPRARQTGMQFVNTRAICTKVGTY